MIGLYHILYHDHFSHRIRKDREVVSTNNYWVRNCLITMWYLRYLNLGIRIRRKKIVILIILFLEGKLAEVINYHSNPIGYCQLLCSKMTTISIYSIGLIQDTLQLDFSRHSTCGRDVPVRSKRSKNLGARVSLYVRLTSNRVEIGLFWDCREVI